MQGRARRRDTRGGMWRQIALVLLVGVLTHQIVMSTSLLPAHMHPTGMDVHLDAQSGTTPLFSAWEPGTLTMVRTPVTPILPVALGLILLAVRLFAAHVNRPLRDPWHWSAARYRTLLQVFRC